ncbi:nucleoside recognition membrane protein YjiH [Melghirimyces profundicolus]|uniref:Nucleoside recognition membrane protein YjiH n=1 Tax=Melghirimyces profundicolus TaxID=1242148 RepID=A0A2T6BZ03_9BACL|nr:YjiH family protein [Melghirimyces profundicolus]PTX61301.1 nucleoside recognition membrane protein YjiH [Melghirimyces profundicolus]
MREAAEKKRAEGPVLSFSPGDYLWFIIPSVLGILLFMIPIPSNESLTIPIAFVADLINQHFEAWLPTVMTYMMVLSVAGSILVRTLPSGFLKKQSFLFNLFNISNFWLSVRFLGMVFAVMTLYRFGPGWVYSDNTGGLLMYDLVPLLFSIFLLAGLFLPLLLNFGLLELCGALLTKVMRPLFTLPGRSSMDCIASWVGDGTIGVLITTKQYEGGYYTKREAAVIGTTFSVVSITFSIVVISYLKLEPYFVPYYLTIIFSGLIAALIMPRIPPLSRKPDTPYEAAEYKTEEVRPSLRSNLKWGLDQAVTKARNNKRILSLVKEGLQNVVEMWAGVVPVVMAIGTVALIIAEFTPVFQLLGYPFVWLLSAMQVPEAAAAAPTMVLGFADMFLPAVVGSGIESELTRFVIACISVTQLIYMSEIGGLLLGSKLPIHFKDLVIIFLERTLITLPIITAIAHILF